MTETDDGNRIAAMITAWRAEHPDDTRLLQLAVRRWCSEASWHGISVERQLEMLRHYGIGIGRGGQGRNTNVPCDYCGATEPGGHGGLCPEGSSGVSGEGGGPGAGGGGGAALGVFGLPPKES